MRCRPVVASNGNKCTTNGVNLPLAILRTVMKTEETRTDNQAFGIVYRVNNQRLRNHGRLSVAMTDCGDAATTSYNDEMEMELLRKIFGPAVRLVPVDVAERMVRIKLRRWRYSR